MEEPQVMDLRSLLGEPKNQQEQKPTPEEVLQKIQLVDETPKQQEEVKEEEKVEPKAEEKPAEETPKPQKQKTVKENPYDAQLKSLLELGLIKDVAIGIVDENGETQEVHLSELKDLDQDKLKGIVENYKQAEEEDFKSKYISKEGIDEVTEKLIELKKAGGNVESLIQQEVNYIDTLQKMKENISDDQQSANILFHEFKAKGLSDKVAKAQIEEIVENGELTNEAEKIIDREIKRYEDSLEEKRQLQLKEIEAQKEKQKEFLKNFSAQIKEKGIPENVARVIKENVKQNKDGLTKIDELYFSALENPELYADIAFLLHNPTEYKNWVKGSAKVEGKKELMKTAFSINWSNVKTKAKTTEDDITDKQRELADRLKLQT